MQKRYIYILLIFFIYSSILSERKCNDLIILLDPNQNETIEARNLAIAAGFLTAIQEQASPIAVTANIVKNFCFWKTEHKEVLEQIKQIISTNDSATSETKVQEIIKSLSPTKSATFPSYQFAILLSIIDFSNNDWYCYIHKYNKLVFLIPKKYIAQQSSKNNIDDQIEECGFQITDFMKINTISYETLLQQINMENEGEIDLLSAFKSLFITSSLNKSWNIYLMGHGSPAQKKKAFIKDEKYIKESYQSWQDIINTWRSLNQPKNLNRAILAAKPIEEKYHILQSIHSLNDEDLIPQTAHIAGISFDDFFKLMSFFNTINTSFFYYTTCFGGGFNRTFINNILGNLNVRFITVSEGYNESSTISPFPTFIYDTAGKPILSFTPFTNFFGMLNNFFGESIPAHQRKINQQLKKDPIATILSNFTSIENLLKNQPFIRIPSIGVFQAITVDEKVKIITHSIAKAYEFENRDIDLTNPKIQAVLIYPEKIKVPIKLHNNIKIISPTQQQFTAKNHVIHIFDNVKIDGWLSFLLYDFITLNNSYTKTTFVIKDLTCYSSENLKSDIQETWSKDITIKNLIIQIKTDLIAESTTNFYTSIKIAFSINQNDYSFEKSFENTALNQINLMEFFNSSPQPANSQLLQDLADTIDENITLPLVVKYLENKIGETTSVQKVGSLKKILLLKKLDFIEQSTTAQTIEQQIKWLKKKGKPLTTINEKFKKYIQELSILQQNINKLIQAGDFTENEKISVTKKIAAINENIRNVDQIIAQELSKGYFSQFIEKIKDTGQQLYQWFSSKKNN